MCVDPYSDSRDRLTARPTAGYYVLGEKVDIVYLANRAGVLGVSQLVLLVALSGKNNIISFLTGISYERVWNPILKDNQLNILH